MVSESTVSNNMSKMKLNSSSNNNPIKEDEKEDLEDNNSSR